MLKNDSLGFYLDALASGEPTPGGGAAAAITAAQGAALLSMVCNLTLGKKKFSDVSKEVGEILEIIKLQRTVMLDLAQKDADAFQSVMAAYKMSGDDSAELHVKHEAVDNALILSASVPFQLFKASETLLPYADRLEKIGNPNVLSDVLVGRELLEAALRSAKINVEANLKLMNDKGREDSQRRAMADIFKQSY